MESSLRHKQLRELIEKRRLKCGDKEAIVSGVDINKQFIPTRANLEETDISKYYLVPPHHFACNLMHIGRDERLPIAYNHTTDDLVVTSAYYVFRVKEKCTDEIIDEYLYIFFNCSETDRLTWFFTDSSVRGNLSESRFLDIEIPLPSIEEQRKVVNAWRALREIKFQNEKKADPLMQVCQSYIQELKHKYPMQEIGSYIEEYDERNDNGTYSIDDVRGISIEKKIIDTKANMEGVKLNPYKVFRSGTFCYVTITSRNGNKITLALNQNDCNYIVSSSYVTFRVRDGKELIPEFLHLWFCRPEYDRYARFNSWGSAREAFSFEEMKRTKVPLPPIEVQRAIVNIYNCAKEAKQIAAEADRLSRDVCPMLLQHIINQAI